MKKLTESQIKLAEKAISETLAKGAMVSIKNVIMSHMTRCALETHQMFQFSDMLLLYTVNGAPTSEGKKRLSGVYVLSNTKEGIRPALDAYLEQAEAVKSVGVSVISSKDDQTHMERLESAKQSWLNAINQMLK